MNAQQDEIFRVGYFPRCFPRDPVNINTVLEHTLVAQIIESLVNHDADGNVIPGVAQSWKISNDGKEITFNLNAEKQFPNGKNVTAEDVKYSIDRHRTSTVSQSREYLKNISQIVALSTESVVFTLRQPQVSVFKVLSRSHLGIVPFGWEFNNTLEEPIVGTGDYRIIKESGKWHLVFRKGRNSGSNSNKETKVNTWEILFTDDFEKDIPTQLLADYIPIARRERQEFLIPAWKPPYFGFISDRLEEREALFKYTPQFTDILVLEEATMETGLRVFNDFDLPLEPAHLVTMSEYNLSLCLFRSIFELNYSPER